MADSYLESEMNQKIPIKITWIENQEGISEPEVVIDAEDYFDFEGSITDALIKFKKEYSNLLKKTASLKEDPKRTGQMKRTWQLGKELAKFNERVKNQFIILNHKPLNSFFCLPEISKNNTEVIMRLSVVWFYS